MHGIKIIAALVHGIQIIAGAQSTDFSISRNQQVSIKSALAIISQHYQIHDSGTCLIQCLSHASESTHSTTEQGRNSQHSKHITRTYHLGGGHTAPVATARPPPPALSPPLLLAHGVLLLPPSPPLPPPPPPNILAKLLRRVEIVKCGRL